MLRAEEAGSLDDRVNVGDIVVPVNTIVGLSSATIGDVVTDGVDEESDDNLRQRLVEKSQRRRRTAIRGSLRRGVKQFRA